MARRSAWTKELDVRLVQAINDECGPTADVVRHQETQLPWEKLLKRLRDASGGWPDGIDSTKALKQRWDSTFRGWYAKAGLLDAQDEDGKRLNRATIIRLSKLLELLRSRDYVLEGRPGRRKSSTPKRKNTIEGTEESNSSSNHVTSQKKVRVEQTDVGSSIMSSLNSDRRLQAWLVLLKTPEFVSCFRLHSQSGIEIEPKIIVDGILGHGTDVSSGDLISLAKTIATPEWRNRVCDISDAPSIQKLLSQKVSFFLFPSKKLSLEGLRFMFTYVCYPSATSSVATLRSFFDEKTEAQATTAVPEMLRTLGLQSIFANEGVTSSHTTVKSKLPFAVLTLATFQECLNPTSLALATFLFDEHVRHKLLAAILYPPTVTFRFAPSVEALPLPYKSVYDAADSLPGIRVPPWCRDIPDDKRVSQLSAIFAALKVTLLVADLNVKDQHLTRERDPSESDAVLLVENKGLFCVLLRIKKTSVNQAALSLVAPTASVQELKINRCPVVLGHSDVRVDVSARVQIDVTLADDVKILLTY